MCILISLSVLFDLKWKPDLKQMHFSILITLTDNMATKMSQKCRELKLSQKMEICMPFRNSDQCSALIPHTIIPFPKLAL